MMLDFRARAGLLSSPVCRIKEKLANMAFASSFFAQNGFMDFTMDLIDKS